jgi:hypothetical protein
MPRFDDLTPEGLEQIRRFIEEAEIEVVADENARACREALALASFEAAAATKQ